MTQTEDQDFDVLAVEHATESDRASQVVNGDCNALQSEFDRLTKEISGLRAQRSASGDVESRLLELQLREVQESLKVAKRARSRL